MPISKKNVAASSAEVVIVGGGSAVRNAMARGQFVAAAGEASVVDDGYAAVVIAIFIYEDHFLRRQFDVGGFEGMNMVRRNEDGTGPVILAIPPKVDQGVRVDVGAGLCLEAFSPFFVRFAAEEVGGKTADIGSDGAVARIIDFFDGHVSGVPAGNSVAVPENPVFALRSPSSSRCASRKSVFVVVQIHGKGDAQLFKVAHAVDFVRLGLGFGQSGKEHSRQNRNDRDDD